MCCPQCFCSLGRNRAASFVSGDRGIRADSCRPRGVPHEQNLATAVIAHGLPSLGWSHQEAHRLERLQSLASPTQPSLGSLQDFLVLIALFSDMKMRDWAPCHPRGLGGREQDSAAAPLLGMGLEGAWVLLSKSNS